MAVGEGFSSANVERRKALELYAKMMLKYIGEAEVAGPIYAALVRLFTERRLFTPDLGGSSTTTEFGKAAIDAMGV